MPGWGQAGAPLRPPSAAEVELGASLARSQAMEALAVAQAPQAQAAAPVVEAAPASEAGPRGRPQPTAAGRA